jgi:hypothetical protein
MVRFHKGREYTIYSPLTETERTGLPRAGPGMDIAPPEERPPVSTGGSGDAQHPAVLLRGMG